MSIMIKINNILKNKLRMQMIFLCLMIWIIKIKRIERQGESKYSSISSYYIIQIDYRVQTVADMQMMANQYIECNDCGQEFP